MKIALVFFLFASFFSTGQVISTIAGNGIAGYSGDGGSAVLAEINNFAIIRFDSNDDLYLSQRLNHIVRKITQAGIITTVAGSDTIGFAGDGGSATLAKLNNPVGVALDIHGNLYISDLGNNRIRKVSSSTGLISTLAGNGIMGFSGDGGQATNASISGPQGICVDYLENVYFSDHDNARIRKIDIAGIITTVAGNGINGNTGDGTQATSAEIFAPFGICCDYAGNLYITSAPNIRKINLSTGIISTVAGNDTAGYAGDGGPAIHAKLNYAFDVSIDMNNNIFIADSHNNRIRKVDTLGTIQTIAGVGLAGFTGDGGLADTAKMTLPEGLAFDRCSNLYIADLGNFRIRRVAFPGPPLIVTVSSPTSSIHGDSVHLSTTITGGCCNSFTVSWMNHGVVFATGTNAGFIKGTGIDSITAKVTGCGDTAVSSVHVITNAKVGISGPHSQTANVRVYPNPVQTTLTITASCIISNITVCDLPGRQVLYKPATDTREIIDIAHLPAGTYIVKITDSEGSVTVRKIVKE